MNWRLEEALGWFDRVYQRTLEVAQAVPEEFMGWRPAPDEFSCGDLIRHLASTELMNARRLADGKLVYPGHEEQFGEHREEALAYLEAAHAEARRLFESYGEDGMTRLVPTNQGQIAGWRVLVGMIEHEIHHRSQLCSYLSQLLIAPPPLFGLYVEDLPTA